ncbi:MAG: NAD(+) synthase [Ectothiorhodospiraceae bacterium]|nr:NAD(+) synthase [Chromatiales bacterium]MCP5155438.1 NAD(+) synthase [Ectothiorhodospiraceae bacterium]
MDPTRLPRIALAQMEVRPGRPDVNVARMIALLAQARDAGAEVVAFPELCVSGYILGDLWEVDVLVDDFAEWSESVREASAGLTVVFGNVVVDPAAIGEDGRRRKYNAVRVCHDGRWLAREVPGDLPPGTHPKTLHPNYRYFDDDRHFYSVRKLALATGHDWRAWMRPFEVPLRDGRRFRFGVQLCEDMWCQDYCAGGEVLDTVRAYREAGADAVFNLSSSPWTWQKNDKRNRTVREVLARSPVPFFYVNHVGAQNNGKNVLVHDGDTTAYAPDGTVIARAEPWREALVVVPGDGTVAPAQDEMAACRDGIVCGLRHLDHLRGGESRVLLGVSGGIDSSLVASLLTLAFGPERVFAVNMPTRFNADVTRDNARRMCAALGVEHLDFPIQDLYERLSARIRDAGFAARPGEYSRLVDENIQARIRGADVLAGLAAKCGLLFTNNGNKTETALGYATLYGDVNGAIAPIADLYKTQVFALARDLNQRVLGREVIPANLYDGTTVPSAELSEAQDVTKGLGDPIKYGYHDAVLRQLIEFRRHPLDLMGWAEEGTLLERIGWDDPAAFRRWFADAGEWVADLEWIETQLRQSYFKRVQAPPIVVLSKRAFGFDLRESQLPAYRPRGYDARRDGLCRSGLPRLDLGPARD